MFSESKAIEDFILWAYDNMAWNFVSFFFSTMLFAWIILPIVNGWRLARRILKNNKNSDDGGYGTYAADVFLKSWDGQDYNEPLVKQRESAAQTLPCGVIAEEHLLQSGLVSIHTNPRSRKRFIYAKKDLRGWVVRLLIKRKTNK